MPELPWPVAHLPRWAVLLSEHSDFDPLEPWCSIYCTGRNQHDPELLGVVFAAPDGQRLYGGPHIHLSQLNEARLNVEAEASDDPVGVLWSAGPPGAVNLTCPSCPLGKRASRGDWSRLADAVEIPGRFDASRLP